MVLHTLNAAPFSAAFRDCIQVAQPGDAIVLMGDGVYAALPGTAACNALQARGVELYTLRSDTLIAGIHQPAPNISVIDMDGLVTLTERFTRQLAWY